MQGEPRHITAARTARLSAQFQERQLANSWDELIGIDAMKVREGRMPSQFTVTAYRLAAHAAGLKRGR